MKIFSWLRNKYNNAKEVSNKPNQEPLSHPVKQQAHKEEFSDWPNGLLTIGTFGNNKHSEKSSTHVENSTSEENNEELDKELTILLNKHIFLGESENKHNLLVDKLLDWLIKKHGKKNNVELSENKEFSRHLQRTISVIQKEGKEIFLDNNNNKSGISKKSLSFLLKKTFLCRGGFVPNPILRDPLQDPPKLENSRLEKILRAMLHKKIYPQKPAQNNSSKKYLDMGESDIEEENDHEEEGKNESKWVKTDSEFIVLEI